MHAVKKLSLSKLTTLELRILADGVVSTLHPITSDFPFLKKGVTRVQESLHSIHSLHEIPQGEELLTEIAKVEKEMFTTLKTTCDILITNVGKAGYDPGKAGASGKLLELCTIWAPSLFEEDEQLTRTEVADVLRELFRKCNIVHQKNAEVSDILLTIKRQYRLLNELQTVYGDDKYHMRALKRHSATLEYHLESLFNSLTIYHDKRVDGFTEVIGPFNDHVSSVVERYESRTQRYNTTEIPN